MDEASSSAAEVAEKILGRARACLLNSDYGHAFANFLMLLKVSPRLKSDVKEEFAVSLNEWVLQLDQRGQTKDAFWCFEQAMELWPDNDKTLNSMGAFLFKLGFPDEAASYLRKALHINPHLHTARESLQSVASSVVERWHFRMLNDITRNAGYLAAIKEAVRMGHDTVLDIGSGTGLLSMFAVQSGAKSVYACEMSKTMYEMSHDVLAANQMQDQVSLFHKKSTELTIPDDVFKRVSLMVTETMDAGLLGEHILETLHHAWQHLLLPPPQGRVIPSGAIVYGQVIECEGLRKRHRLISDSVGNLDLKNIDIVSKAVHLGQSAQNDVEADYEPYTSEKLSTVTGGYMTLTPVFKVMEFDFQDFKHLAELQTRLQQSQIIPTVHCKGQIDAIVTWFDLSLDENHSLSTAAGCESCWEQAIYPVHQSQLKGTSSDKTALNVQKGDNITIAMSCAKDHLSLICQEISHNAPFTEAKGHDSHSPFGKSSVELNGENETQNSKLLFQKDGVPDAKMETKIQNSEQISTSDDYPDLDRIDLSSAESNVEIKDESQHFNFVTAATLKNVKKEPLHLEEHNLGVLNDLKTQTALLSAIQNVLTKLQSDSSVDSTAEMSVDVKRTHLKSQNKDTSSASISTDETIPDITRTQPKFEKVDTNLSNSPNIQINDGSNFQGNLNKTKLSILDLSEILSPVALYAAKFDDTANVCITQPNQDIQHALQCIGKSNGLDMESCVTFQSKSDILHPKCNALWDVVIVDPVEPTGVLRQQVLEDIAVARSCCLKPSGQIIPGKMSVFGMCIESESLLTDSKVVGNERTMDLAIAKYVNVFKTSTQLDLNLSTLGYKQLSLPFLLFHFDFNHPCETVEETPPYLSQSKTLTVEITQDGRFIGIPFWFDLGMDKDNHVNTMDRSTYWRQAAFLLEEPMEVKKGQKVIVIATVKDSSIWFDVRR